MRGYNDIHIYVDNNDGDPYWVAEYTDLNGCIGTGKTKEAALKDLDLAKQSWLEAKEKMNKNK